MNPTPRSNVALAEEFYRICKGYYHDQAVEQIADKLAERDALAPEMAEALAKIADHDGTEPVYGSLDEWTQAAAFSQCQTIARAILARLNGEGGGV